MSVTLTKMCVYLMIQKGSLSDTVAYVKRDKKYQQHQGTFHFKVSRYSVVEVAF